MFEVRNRESIHYKSKNVQRLQTALTLTSKSYAARLISHFSHPI
ncbi:hypothetical protein [Bacillus tropicus]